MSKPETMGQEAIRLLQERNTSLSIENARLRRWRELVLEASTTRILELRQVQSADEKVGNEMLRFWPVDAEVAERLRFAALVDGGRFTEDTLKRLREFTRKQLSGEISICLVETEEPGTQVQIAEVVLPEKKDLPKEDSPVVPLCYGRGPDDCRCGGCREHRSDSLDWTRGAPVVDQTTVQTEATPSPNGK